MSLPMIQQVKTINSSAIAAIGISSATLLIVSKNGIGYGYPVSALRKAMGGFGAVCRLFSQIKNGEVSAGQSWAQIKKAVDAQGKKARRYTAGQTAKMLNNPINTIIEGV